ncbi:hypothetical protein I553_7751 [Mycobacterium xenopi 4042]|uniref:Uncharacterized protein n=1 Tax=Mycobacterium xenopi 4042 TaxID=1299334 RepID=X8AQE6_MYCXE|nr:hypothetical protein I553_7751 [Mycobacterium xenopi 4042]
MDPAYATCEWPPQTPDTEEHNRTREFGRNGHNSTIEASPVIRAAKT